jgi:flagellar motility protein MotE (MotC chaperone)/tRNA A-37 threonylcarbamoyl transferase component Bud32
MTSPRDELAGRYRLEKRLGAGAMGSVWKAQDMLLGRTVAVKELVPRGGCGEGLALRRARAEKEARALAKVAHPAIVIIHDLVFERDDPWIIMGYANGQSLDKIIRDDPRDDREVAAIGLPVLHGLMACHARGVYHRDVKPANIVVAVDGSVRLVDFGVAKIVGEYTLTSNAVLPGTPEYLAPELLKGKPAGPSTDLWALGVTLYCALERRSPFAMASLDATIAAILHQDPPVPESRGALASLVLQMLRKDPSDRPDGAAVAAVLRQVISGSATAERPWRSGPGRANRGYRAQPFRKAAAIVSESPAPAAVASLLELPDTQAAEILSGCAHHVAAQVIGGIAVGDPERAGRMLEIWTADRAARVFDLIGHDDGAKILDKLTAVGAARILLGCEARTAADALTEMPPRSAARLVRVLGDERAAAVLSIGAPVSVAAILAVLPAEQRERLLWRLPADYGALVRSFM